VGATCFPPNVYKEFQNNHKDTKKKLSISMPSWQKKAYESIFKNVRHYYKGMPVDWSINKTIFFSSLGNFT